MNSLKTNIAHLLLMTFLAVFGLEMISYSFCNHVWENIAILEVPFDAEEEGKKKTEKEKEWNDKAVSKYESIGFGFTPLLNLFKLPLLYCSIPRETVTPPPEFRS